MVESAAVPAPVDNRPSLIRRRLYIQEYLQFRYALLFVLLTAVGAVTGHVLPKLDTLLGSNLWPFRVFSLVLILFIIVEIIFLSLSFTHKNVGPIYNLRMYLEKAVEEKNLTGRVQFRQTDELHELAERINNLLDDEPAREYVHLGHGQPRCPRYRNQQRKSFRGGSVLR